MLHSSVVDLAYNLTRLLGEFSTGNKVITISESIENGRVKKTYAIEQKS